MNFKPFRSLVFSVLVGLSATPAWGNVQDVNSRIDSVLGGHMEFQLAFQTLQRAVRSHDKTAVAGLMRYPMVVRLGRKKEVIKSPKDFVAQYHEIVTPTVAKIVNDQDYGDLYVSNRGLMFGDGEVWVSNVCKDEQCDAFEIKVSTIQVGCTFNR